MDEECLCLTWNNQGATYQQMLNHLRVENILTDCTLACDGQKFSVHRLVLVTCSDFFKSLLGDVPCQHPIVYLRGINGPEMQALIEFMYLGKVDVPQREMSNLLSTAEALQIKGLGVFNPHIKNESGHSSYKRKRSPTLSDSEALEVRSPKEGVSSLSRERSSCEGINRDRHYSSPKRNRNERAKDKVNSNSHRSASKALNLDEQRLRSRDRADAIGNKNCRNEDTYASHFKSSPITSSSSSTIPLSAEFNSTSVPEPSNYTVLSSRSSSVEGQTLAKLTTLQPYLPDHSRSSDYYASCLEDASESKMTPTSCYLSENLNKEQTFGNLSKIKEEGVDCSRNSSADKMENSLLPSHYPKEPQPRERDQLNSFPRDDSTPLFDNISRNPNMLQLPYIQDENSETGTESSRPYLCPICRKSFAKVAILKRHHLAHFRPYNCHLCSRSFTRREVLAEHVLEHNGADLRLPCPVCKMTIKRKRNLQAHIKVKHPEYHKQKSANNEALC